MLGPGGTVALRVPGLAWLRGLVHFLGEPITATSANLSGEAVCSTAADVAAQLGRKVDAVIDGGKTQGGSASTILDMTLNPPVVIREGAIPASRIYDVLRRERNV